MHRRWRPTLGLAHRLLGLAVSLWLMLLGTTGALLVFKEDWLRLVQPGATGPPPSGEMLTPTGLAQRAAAAEAAFGAEQIRSMVLAGSAIALDQVYLRDHAGGGYLDPRTGAILAHWAEGERLVDVLFDLHHTLLLGEGGKTAVGVVGLLGVTLVLTGLVLAWPMLRRLRGRVWPRTTTRSGLIAVHRELGVFVALPLLVLMLTGTAVVFPSAARILLSGTPAPAVTLAPGAVAPPAASSIAWEAVFSIALQCFPEASFRVVVWPPTRGGSTSVRLRQPVEWHPNGRTVVRVTAAGSLFDTHDAVAASRADRLVYTAYPIHAAKVGGLPYRLLVAVAGLALALLSAYGAIGYARYLLCGGPPPNTRIRTGNQSPRTREAESSAPAGDRA